MLAIPEQISTTIFKYNDEWTIPRDRVEFYLTHDFHPYFAAFPPKLVSRILKHHTKPGDVFLDPFMGGGTSIVEGVVNNRKVIGCDISPFSKLLCSVKSTPIKITDGHVKKIITNIKKSLSNRYSADFSKYDRIVNVQRWFDNDNLTELDSIYNCINKIENTNIRNFFLVAFSSILRKSSNAKNAEQHLCIKINKTKISPFDIFCKKVELMRQQMDIYYKNYRGHAKPKLYVNDVRNLSGILPKNSIDIIITSPPYGTGSKYTNIYKLNYEWFDLAKPKRKSLEQSKDFRLELKKALVEIHHVLKPNKYCFLVYGDPSTNNSLTTYAIEDSKELGFYHKGTISCPIKKTMAKHYVKYTQSIPRDFIIVLQKQN